MDHHGLSRGRDHRHPADRLAGDGIFNPPCSDGGNRRLCHFFDRLLGCAQHQYNDPGAYPARSLWRCPDPAFLPACRDRATAIETSIRHGLVCYCEQRCTGSGAITGGLADGCVFLALDILSPGSARTDAPGRDRLVNSAAADGAGKIPAWRLGGIIAMALGLSALQIMLEEGGRKDWFSSRYIVEAALVAAIGLVAFVVIELRRKDPFLNLRLLCRYNFGLASLMQFTFGAVVFGVVFLIPNYFSDVHGYNARQIGLTMIPYGVVQFLMSFATPPLMKRTSVRSVIVLGFVIMAAGCLMNIHLDANAASNVIVPSLIVRGIGQSLIVVALGVMAVEGLEKAELGSASGVFSMVRNVGGAIGIAVASQFIVSREKLHAFHIGESVTPFSQATRERMVELVRFLARAPLDRATALYDSGFAPERQQAIAILDKIVHREALLLTYSDAFLVAGVAMLGCAGGSLLLRSKRRKSSDSSR